MTNYIRIEQLQDSTRGTPVFVAKRATEKPRERKHSEYKWKNAPQH